jgi:hypothetical protein
MCEEVDLRCSLSSYSERLLFRGALFTWWTISNPSLVLVSSPLVVLPMPALLARISRARPVDSQRFANASTVDKSAISQGHHSILDDSWPAALAAAMQSATVTSGCFSWGGGWRHPRTILAPHDANRKAASLPMPLFPPVITIHLPRRSPSRSVIWLPSSPRAPCQRRQSREALGSGGFLAAAIYIFPPWCRFSIPKLNPETKKMH